MSKPLSTHPWRGRFAPAMNKPRANNDHSAKPQDDFHGPGTGLAERAFGSRLHRGFDELDSSYDEKGNR